MLFYAQRHTRYINAMFYVTVLTVYIITTLAKAVSERKMVGKINALPNTFVLEIDTNN